MAEKVKKPFFKKWWFWLIAVVIVIAIAAGGGDSESTSTNKSSNKTDSATAKSEKKKDKRYKVGDTVEVDDVEFTLKNVTLTNERNEFADTEPAKVVKIDYEMINNTDEDISYGADLQVYDGTGNKVESYPNDNSMGSIKPGKKVQGTAHFGIEKGPIEVYFKPIVSFADDAIFEVDID